ncbi:hypothetical protein ACLOJK_041487, partial [Asimina triloba]
QLGRAVQCSVLSAGTSTLKLRHLITVRLAAVMSLQSPSIHLFFADPLRIKTQGLVPEHPAKQTG